MGFNKRWHCNCGAVGDMYSVNPNVRYGAIHACPKCGIESHKIPVRISKPVYTWNPITWFKPTYILKGDG